MNKRIEVFSAQCPCCEDALNVVRDLAAPSDQVTVIDMNDPTGYRRAKELGVARVPAIAIDGRLASCCSGSGIDAGALREMGIGA